MNFNPVIIVLIVFSLLTFISMLVFHKFTYKITRNYYFLMCLSSVFLIYFLIFRWIPDLIDFINIENILELKITNPYLYSLRWSKILLLDMCPLTMFLVPITLIFDKTKNLSKIIAPVALIGTFVTLFGGMWDQTIVSYEFKEIIKYIFIGANDENRIYFLMHFFILILSTLTILNCKQFTKWSFCSTIIWLLLFLFYELIIINTLGIKNNVTGLVPGDWFSNDSFSQYGTVYKLLPMSFPGIVVFWYSVALFINLFICLIKNYLTNDIFKLHKFNKNNSKFMQFKNIKLIDIWIDNFFSKYKVLLKKNISKFKLIFCYK